MENYKKVCPKCGSTNIGIPPAGMDIRMTIKDYCRDCGNFGMFPEVKDSDLEDFRKKLKKK